MPATFICCATSGPPLSATPFAHTSAHPAAPLTPCPTSLPAGWSPAKVIRRIGFTAFGVYGTEANPDFLAEVEAAVPKKAGGMILVCNIGGSLTPTGG
jgi:hypothetical protein